MSILLSKRIGKDGYAGFHSHTDKKYKVQIRYPQLYKTTSEYPGDSFDNFVDKLIETILCEYFCEAIGTNHPKGDWCFFQDSERFVRSKTKRCSPIEIAELIHEGWKM